MTVALNHFQKADASAAAGHCLEVGRFTKASKSNGSGGNNCVEAGVFAKAVASGPNCDNCVEVGGSEDLAVILVRDTKQADMGDARTVLSYTPDEWEVYLGSLKLGHGGIYAPQDDVDLFVVTKDSKHLVFNLGEWTAFMDGVHKAEFDLPSPMPVLTNA